METISHRELRNRSGAVLKAVASGESYTITNDGRPVAELRPVQHGAAELPVSRPAIMTGGFADMERLRMVVSTQDALDDIRGEG